jgi:hypothetical protein
MQHSHILHQETGISDDGTQKSNEAHQNRRAVDAPHILLTGL